MVERLSGVSYFFVTPFQRVKTTWLSPGLPSEFGSVSIAATIGWPNWSSATAAETPTRRVVAAEAGSSRAVEKPVGGSSPRRRPASMPPSSPAS